MGKAESGVFAVLLLRMEATLLKGFSFRQFLFVCLRACGLYAPRWLRGADRGLRPFSYCAFRSSLSIAVQSVIPR